MDIIVETFIAMTIELGMTLMNITASSWVPWRQWIRERKSNCSGSRELKRNMMETAMSMVTVMATTAKIWLANFMETADATMTARVKVTDTAMKLGN